MTTSTDAIMCYGVAFEEDTQFPWTDEDGDSGEDAFKEWWLNLNGFKHSFEIYNERGEYIEGKRPTEEVFSRYYQEDQDFLAAHPLPAIEIVQHCSYDSPMHILAVKGSVTTANRGYPEKLDISKLVVTDQQRRSLLDFCRQYIDGIVEGEEAMAWYIASMWG